ncbi:MAG: AAA family ATPase [Verrucomicrobiota bacterium]
MTMISTFIEHSAPREPDGQATESAAAELLSLARQVEAWRVAWGLSLRQLCSQVTGINHKTHSRLADGDLTELTPENHLAKYRAAVVELEEWELRQQADPILPGLRPARIVAESISMLKRQRDIDRFMLVEGESGAGKTSAVKNAAASDADAILVTAHEGWHRPLKAITELLLASGFRGVMPNGFADRHAALIQKLADKPRLILVDEGQHMEIRLLNVLKDVINRTGCWVVIATMASLWNNIQSRHWSEVKQLIHNRMLLRVTLPAPDSGDVEEYLAARLALTLPEEKGEAAVAWQRAFDAVSQGARHHGGYAFCRKVAGAARLLAMKSKTGGPAAEHLLSAASYIIANTKGFDR